MEHDAKGNRPRSFDPEPALGRVPTIIQTASEQFAYPANLSHRPFLLRWSRLRLLDRSQSVGARLQFTLGGSAARMLRELKRQFDAGYERPHLSREGPAPRDPFAGAGRTFMTGSADFEFPANPVSL
jgi:hypothetical protein